VDAQIAELERGGLRFYGGNYESYREQKANEQAAAAQAVHAAREKLEKARIHAVQATERQAKRAVRGRKDFLVNGGMPKILAGARKRRAQETAGRLGDVHEERISAAEETLRTARERHVENAPFHLDLVSPETKGSRRVLACEGANVQFADGRWLWAEDLSLTLTNGERVAIRGGNGAGKTFLLKMLAGLVEPTRGRIVRNAKRAVYLDQHTAILQPGTVLENARRYASDRDESELRLLLARMGLPNDAVFKDVGILSGGERVRAALACLMAAQQAPDLLMLDEPDNHLDLQAMLTTSEALQRYEGTLVVVSHDEAFLESLDIDREVTLSPLPPLGEFER
jgi:ATPase subunit of ABC transporter with duplicated ATPase domains